MNNVCSYLGRNFVTRVLSVCSLTILTFAAHETLHPVSAVAQSAPPDLSGTYYRGLYMKPPPGIEAEVILPSNGVIPGMFGPGPIRHQTGSDPEAYFSLGDNRSPILKHRAMEAVMAHNEAVDAGRMTPPSTQPCEPSGLFMQLTNPGAMRITQTLDQITLEFQSDGDRRVIYMNAEHPADVAPSMNGHSIGRWDGSTLIVDTIGIDQNSPLDRYGTPHSTGLHVVESIRLLRDGRSLEDYVFAEDTANFFAPWWGVVTYRPYDESWEDQACAE